MSILTPIDATCLTCRWWRRDAEATTGSCHRHAPPWPLASETDICGDWDRDVIPLLRRD